MAREEVGNKTVEFIKYSDLNIGDEVEGWYTGKRLSQFKGANGEDKFDHTFQRKDGSVFVLNGVGQLDSKMSFIPAGTWTIVQYGGKETMAKGPFAGTKAHHVKVFTDKEVPCPTPAFAALNNVAAPTQESESIPF